MTRAQHRRRTLLALNQAAVAAIEEHGPDVPLEEIADRAGVARRTIYRWAQGREELVFVHARLWLDVFDAAARAGSDEPVAQRIRLAAAAVCETIDANPEPVARSMRLVLDHPQLLRGYSSVNQEWIERIATEVRTGTVGSVSRFRSRAIAAAIMGMIDAALYEWVSEDTHEPIGTLIADGLDHLNPLLADL